VPIRQADRGPARAVLDPKIWVGFQFWSNSAVYLPDSGSWLHAEAAPGATMDDIVEKAQPLLEALAITPIPRGSPRASVQR
jgi:hypothetical protein